MELKDNIVSLEGCSAPLLFAAFIVEQVMHDLEPLGLPCVVTAAKDRYHTRVSLHYSGNALDFRSRSFHSPDAIVTEVKRRLGDHYDFILEGDHFHLEFQPHRPTVVDAWDTLKRNHPDLSAEMEALYNP